MSLRSGRLGSSCSGVAEQEVDVEVTLVRLVDDERVVGREQSISLRFREQDAVGHDLQVSIVAHAVLEADLVADPLAERRGELVRDAVRDGARGDAPRLGVADETRRTAAEREADLRQLRRLAGARFAADDDDLVGRDGRGDLIALRRHRQRLGKGGRWQGRQPRLALRARRRDFLRQHVDLLGRCTASVIKLAQSAQKLAALAGRHAVESGTQRLDSGSIARLHQGGMVPSAFGAYSLCETRHQRRAPFSELFADIQQVAGPAPELPGRVVRLRPDGGRRHRRTRLHEGVHNARANATGFVLGVPPTGRIGSSARTCRAGEAKWKNLP